MVGAVYLASIKRKVGFLNGLNALRAHLTRYIFSDKMNYGIISDTQDLKWIIAGQIFSIISDFHR